LAGLTIARDLGSLRLQGRPCTQSMQSRFPVKSTSPWYPTDILVVSLAWADNSCSHRVRVGQVEWTRPGYLATTACYETRGCGTPLGLVLFAHANSTPKTTGHSRCIRVVLTRDVGSLSSSAFPVVYSPLLTLLPHREWVGHVMCAVSACKEDRVHHQCIRGVPVTSRVSVATSGT